MLNANAKAFVPGGDRTPAVVESPLFRYTLSVPPKKNCDFESQSQLPHLSILLSRRQIMGVPKAGSGLQITQQFVAEFFSSLSNTPHTPATHAPTGFLLSRDLLSLSAPDVLLEVSEREGFVIPLDEVPGAPGALDVGTFVDQLWERFFASFGRDFRVSMLGYFHSQIAPLGEDGEFKHFFFVVTKKSQLVSLDAESFTSISKRVFSVKRLVSYALSATLPIGVILYVDKQSDDDSVKRFDVDLGDVNSLRWFASSLRQWIAIASGTSQGSTLLAAVAVNVKASKIPFVDAVSILCETINGVAGSVIGIVAEEDKWKQISKGLHASWRLASSLSPLEIAKARRCVSLNRSCSLRLPLGDFHFPFGVRLGIDEYTALLAEVRDFDTHERSPTPLTRECLARTIDCFAQGTFRIRRNFVGVDVVVVVDGTGKVYCIDSRERNAVLIAPSWSNPLINVNHSIFRGVMCASACGANQYQLIIVDVIKMRGADVRQRPLSTRLKEIDSLGLDDALNWRHRSSSHLTLLRASHVSLSQISAIQAAESVASVPTMGLVIMHDNKPFGSDDSQFLWLDNESVTFNFRVDEIEELPGTSGHKVRRAHLSCNDGDGSQRILQSEFVDFFDSSAPLVAEGSIVECMLRRTPNGYWWDLLRDFDADADCAQVSTFSDVDAMIKSPMLSIDEIRELPSTASVLCSRCMRVDEVGKVGPKGYQCRGCWDSTGHGDCVGCGLTYVAGCIDNVTKRFFCEACWSVSSSTRPFASGAPPPPPGASLLKQVLTRAISLIIDRVAQKGPNSDVLDLCCGRSVVRKWIAAGAVRFTGVDMNPSAVEDTLQTIRSNSGRSSVPASPTSQNSNAAPLAKFDVLHADVLARETWTTTLSKVHPNPFHIITLFSALHRAFSNEDSARNLLFSIGNALMPNGLFITCVSNAKLLFSKGRSFSNGLVQIAWEDDSHPWMGGSYEEEFLDFPGVSKKHVVPLDVLVALAADFDLVLVKENCHSVADLIAEDDRWTRGFSPEEREYFAARTMLVFKKASQRVPKTEVA